MKTAVKGATKWFLEKAKANPIPYALFKAILNKQIEWARKRNVVINFEELAKAVRAELLKEGIYTMADDTGREISTPKQKTASLFDNAESGEGIPPLLINFSSVGEALSATVIFDWLARTLSKAKAEKYSGLELTAREIKEARR